VPRYAQGSTCATCDAGRPAAPLIGIYFLETGIIGLQILGYSGWVQGAFYGAGLVAAVTIAHLVRNRTRVA
jgi:ribose transport system permease protein